MFTGSSDAIVASRLSYYLNLMGPAMVVNTGCSSSAATIHLACESLRRGDYLGHCRRGLCQAGHHFACCFVRHRYDISNGEMLHF
ncbi:hypothetical protein KQR57_05280 [Bacillus inaquosorum]|nr:hypothetical protein [Bacillus inaquosorum]